LGTSLQLPTAREWAQRCNADGEFRLAARHWSGGLHIKFGERRLALILTQGSASEGMPDDGPDVLGFSGATEVWEKMLHKTPPPGYNDVIPALELGLSRTGDPLGHARFHGAVMRAIELLRPAVPSRPPRRDEDGITPRFDAVTGRYIHLELDGHDHRIYFERAGEGIPLLMQHTAGGHASQFRHLFENEDITEHFDLITYDLPFHGKSLPPVSRSWWAEEYRLTGEFLRSVPVTLANALRLKRPVFMGCSVGGLLALDLALHHPDVFRAVISLEGALTIDEGGIDEYPELWHPLVGNEFKGRYMEGLVSPTAPVAYRKETGFVYSSGWPAGFVGDLYYYQNEFDIRDTARQISTDQIGVHILSGEYDYSGTPALGRAAHEAIEGSTHTVMTGIGHFPMSEDPERFAEYLKPILEQIRARRD